MDYYRELSYPTSKLFAERLARDVLVNPDKISKVYDLIFDSNPNVAWKAAWIGQKVSENNPQLFTSQHSVDLMNLSLTTSHQGVRRGCLAILRNISLPEPIPVDFLDACFNWMISPRVPVSVQVLSMKILFRFCLIERDIIPEFWAILSTTPPTDYSPGFNAARNKILKKLMNR